MSQEKLKDLITPQASPQRIAQTERAYREAMREQLMNLLRIMNPADVINYGALKYTDLVLYARDWLETEIEEITGESEVAMTGVLDLD